MTDEAKALTKRTAITAGVVLLVLLVFWAPFVTEMGIAIFH